MKRMVLFTLSVAACSFLFAQTLIDRTITINTQGLVDMRSSITNPSSAYYDQFLVQYRASGIQPEFQEMDRAAYIPSSDYYHILSATYDLKDALFGKKTTFRSPSGQTISV